MTSSQPSSLAEASAGSLEPPFSPAPVEDLLRLLAKAARASQLYLPNNPIYQGAINALRGGFTPIWREADELPLVISETEIRWFDAVVADAPAGAAKSSDNLAWLFFKDGVRELTITKGFEHEEVLTLLAIIHRARKAGGDEDDLVTMLWEADFNFLSYRYVDLLSQGAGGNDLMDGGAVQPPAQPNVLRAQVERAVEQSRATGIVSMADFDSSLYLLDDHEIEYLQRETVREYAIDLRTNVVAALLDIFEAQPDPEIRGEALEHIQTLMIYLLAAGDFHGVGFLLREVQSALDRAPKLDAELRRKLEDLPEGLSRADALSQLLQSLDSAPTLPGEAELISLFDQLRPIALATVMAWLGRSQNEQLRRLLGTASGRLAAANTAELVRLIGATQPEVAAEAIRQAGSLRTQAAVPPLGKVLSESNVERRQLAASALAEIGSAGALQALERAIEDPDRDVRITAVRALAANGYRPALARLESVVKGKALRESDLTEKMAFFEGYGALCGDAGVSHLDGILNGKGFLGRRGDPELRACAAIALGRIRTARATESLTKASNEKDVVVRNAVTRALRGAPPA